ncbi:MAG: winged helix-turn-helix transcriptional regulator [Clostridia bacterium]|nr:winged helix-turn-helix transcriptional regulator [Clostridia bacterium]
MGTEWMGRYRPLVAALVRHANINQRISAIYVPVSGDICLRSQEWQVFEYILEHMDDDSHMNMISERLGIPQSTFSKIVKSLCGYGLVDKYQSAANRKNILLRPSEKGLRVYRDHSEDMERIIFEPFFSALDGMSDGDIRSFTEAVELLNDRLIHGDEKAPELRKMP